MSDLDFIMNFCTDSRKIISGNTDIELGMRIAMQQVKAYCETLKRINEINK